ncbi:Uncharacterized protein APZ42_009447 [Daphnia magna]|uniref:Uncharacterized protein n=1 Tax=Daphnia magna TaxID=35525 RepID=A0A164E0C2_9CRUS|nr:Uncharacterized protein APZ42_009447 [Daphnia magna]
MGHGYFGGDRSSRSVLVTHQADVDLAGRLARWSLQLQEFLLRIIHRNGRLHRDADAFSRYPVDAPQELDEQLYCTLAAFSIDTESKSEFQ